MTIVNCWFAKSCRASLLEISHFDDPPNPTRRSKRGVSSRRRNLTVESRTSRSNNLLSPPPDSTRLAQSCTTVAPPKTQPSNTPRTALLAWPRLPRPSRPRWEVPPPTRRAPSPPPCPTVPCPPSSSTAANRASSPHGDVRLSTPPAATRLAGDLASSSYPTAQRTRSAARALARRGLLLVLDLR
jgi:hypothetical protein